MARVLNIDHPGTAALVLGKKLKDVRGLESLPSQLGLFPKWGQVWKEIGSALVLSNGVTAGLFQASLRFIFSSALWVW